MLCLPPGITVPSKVRRRIAYIPVAGLLDLSGDSAKRLSEFYSADDRDMRYPRFIGAPTDFQDCLEMLVKEVWANEGGGLTAWQQLYMLACVKIWFKKYWKWDDDKDSWGYSSGEFTDESDDEDDAVGQETSQLSHVGSEQLDLADSGKIALVPCRSTRSSN